MNGGHRLASGRPIEGLGGITAELGLRKHQTSGLMPVVEFDSTRAAGNGEGWRPPER
jgi:hypothetical protein